MSENFLVCLDTETGDLDPENGDLLTLYMAICNEDFQILDELDLKLKPEGRLPRATAGALAVNKIDLKKHISDPETVVYSVGKERIEAKLRKYLKKRGKYSNLILLGQNVIGFDKGFIYKYLFSRSEWDALVHYGDEDTKVCTGLFKRAGWFPRDVGTLGSLVEFFGIPKRTAHEAKGDVHMCIDVYKAMIDLMKSKKEGGNSQDLISLLEAE